MGEGSRRPPRAPLSPPPAEQVEKLRIFTKPLPFTMLFGA